MGEVGVRVDEEKEKKKIGVRSGIAMKKNRKGERIERMGYFYPTC